MQPYNKTNKTIVLQRFIYFLKLRSDVENENKKGTNIFLSYCQIFDSPPYGQ